MRYLERSRKRRNWRRLQWAALVTIVLGLVISAFQWKEYLKRKNRNIEQAKLDALTTYSLHFLDFFNSLTERAEIGRMVAADVAGEYLRRGETIPVQALISIREAMKRHPVLSAPLNPQIEEPDIPRLEIPGQPRFLTIEENNKIALWDSKEPEGISVLWHSKVPLLVHEFVSLGQPIRTIAVNREGTRFGIQRTDGKIQIWNLEDYREEKASPSLESALDLEHVDDLKRYMKTGRKDELPPYDKLAHRWVVEVASYITRCYKEEERGALGLEPGKSDRLTDRIVEAREKVETNESIEEALVPIMKIGFSKNEAKRILCMTFVNEGHRFQNQAKFQDAKARYEIARRVGALSKNQIDSFIALAEAGEARADGKKATAYKKYAIAQKLNAELAPFIAERTRQLEIDHDGALRFIDRGNNFAIEGDREGAIRAYNSALELDPTLRSQLNPEMEFERRSPHSLQVPHQSTR